MSSNAKTFRVSKGNTILCSGGIRRRLVPDDVFTMDEVGVGASWIEEMIRDRRITPVDASENDPAGQLLNPPGMERQKMPDMFDLGKETMVPSAPSDISIQDPSEIDPLLTSGTQDAQGQVSSGEPAVEDPAENPVVTEMPGANQQPGTTPGLSGPVPNAQGNEVVPHTATLTFSPEQVDAMTLEQMNAALVERGYSPVETVEHAKFALTKDHVGG